VRSLASLSACAWVASRFVLAGAPPAAANGAIYSYIDDRGVRHYTDRPVDTRFRRVPNKAPEGLSITPPARVLPPDHNTYDRVIAHLASRHGVEAALVKAVIAAESAFDRMAISRAGAQGLMQLMPSTALELGVLAPFQPYENIDGGVRYLRSMLDRYGDVQRALAAYNAGPHVVDRYGGIPPYRETQAYVTRVLTYYRGYASQFPRE
jgi:soluble lytic murein transglycosylase-like protein